MPGIPCAQSVQVAYYLRAMDDFAIDRRSKVPSYRQLADLLRARIADGTYAPDDPLPSITTLVGGSGLAVGTVRQALGLLVDEGLAYTVPGRGTFVTPR